MQLTNVSAQGAAKTETFDGYPVKDGKVQGSFYQFSSTIADAQERYDAQKAETQKEEVPVWKKPFVWIYNGISNVLGMIKSAFSALFSCFGSKEAAENNTDKKDSKVK